MQDRSGCIVGLLILIAIINIAGLYLTIDSNSRSTLAMDAMLKRLESIEKRPAGVAQNPTAAKVEGTDTIDFANAEYMQPEAEEGGRRVSAIGSLSGSFNYLIKNEAITSTIHTLANDSLATRNNMRVMEWEPLLAESWERSEDGLTYIIKLRKTAKWQAYKDPETEEMIDAKPVTTDDFVFYWETIQNKDIPAEAARSYLELVDTIEAIDEYTLKVVWKEPYSLAEQTTLGLTPLPRHYYRPDPNMTDKDFAAYLQQTKRNQYLIGYGPYLMDSYEPNVRVTLKRNEDYYGPKPPIKTLIMRVIRDPNVQLEQFRNGTLDANGLLPEQWLKETVGKDFHIVTPTLEDAIEDSWTYDKKKREGDAPIGHKFEKFQYKARSWRYIGYNMGRPMFQDKRVRKALTHLTNRKRILRDVLKNFGTIMAGPFVPASPYCDKSIKPLAFDPEKAKTLLKEAGWEDTDGDGWLDKDLDGDGTREPFRYTLMIVSISTQQQEYAPIIQQDMKAAGIDMQIAPFEWNVYLSKLEEKDFDVCTLGWTGTIESDPNQIWHSKFADKEASSNHVGFKSEEADKLIEEGRRTLDTEKRIEIYRKFFRLLHDEQPYTFLFNGVSLVTYDKRYRNLRVYEIGMDSGLIWVPKSQQKATF